MRWLVLMLALWPLGSWAQGAGLPEPLSDTVSDFAGVIAEDTEALIVQELLRHRAETGVQMVVVTLDQMQGGLPGERVEDYATRLFNAWGVGEAARNDGLMILLVVQDRVVRIATGAAYERVFDGYAQRVIDTTMLPAFREGRYGDGLRDGVASARVRIIDRFLAAEGGAPVQEDPVLMPLLAGLATIIGVPGAIGWLWWRRRRKCPGCGRQGLQRSRKITRKATGTLAGEGVETMRCRFCDHRDSRSYSVRQPSRSGGGFGGGRSRGGGATGRW